MVALPLYIKLKNNFPGLSFITTHINGPLCKKKVSDALHGHAPDGGHCVVGHGLEENANLGQDNQRKDSDGLENKILGGVSAEFQNLGINEEPYGAMSIVKMKIT
ncbi:hypothetical protein QVD17_35954 [Tagetes erecta]|uniref:Uncharacterized protein n=1 Tax=Tagetes erecta TaxID=13708 RepID=A0AAD8NIN6_TARER|nr:hypothetical protein QVD17_35954 [Tagetes erecta]